MKLGWRRVRFTLAVSVVFGVLLSLTSQTATFIVITRVLIVGVAVLLAFALFERWPKRLPRWLARSALQLVAIAVVIPPSAAFAYALTTTNDEPWYKDRGRVGGFARLTLTGLLFAPWIAVGALLKQRDAVMREQALELQLTRSEIERQALEAELRLLQAQIEPHFLFNTLANIQTLVDAGSPHASRVLNSLIAYLRAAVPRMHQRSTTLGQEVELARAYLEVMQMRMPDRLKFVLRTDPRAANVSCPPMTLLTLVENAVRHGIDPSEVGGCIDIDVWLRDDRCHIRVQDDGVGLRSGSHSLGTGLAALRERLQLAFAGAAQTQLLEVRPHGVCAEIEFPIQRQAQ